MIFLDDLIFDGKYLESNKDLFHNFLFREILKNENEKIMFFFQFHLHRQEDNQTYINFSNNVNYLSFDENDKNELETFQNQIKKSNSKFFYSDFSNKLFNQENFSTEFFNKISNNIDLSSFNYLTLVFSKKQLNELIDFLQVSDFTLLSEEEKQDQLSDHFLTEKIKHYVKDFSIFDKNEDIEKTYETLKNFIAPLFLRQVSQFSETTLKNFTPHFLNTRLSNSIDRFNLDFLKEHKRKILSAVENLTLECAKSNFTLEFIYEELSLKKEESFLDELINFQSNIYKEFLKKPELITGKTSFSFLNNFSTKELEHYALSLIKENPDFTPYVLDDIFSKKYNNKNSKEEARKWFEFVKEIIPDEYYFYLLNHLPEKQSSFWIPVSPKSIIKQIDDYKIEISPIKFFLNYKVLLGQKTSMDSLDIFDTFLIELQSLLNSSFSVINYQLEPIVLIPSRFILDSYPKQLTDSIILDFSNQTPEQDKMDRYMLVIFNIYEQLTKDIRINKDSNRDKEFLLKNKMILKSGIKENNFSRKKI